MQVVYPTTPAQLFHLLRRQMLIRTRKPLIVMGPKSLLRQKLSFSTLDELSKGSFQPLLPESDSIKTARCRRLILCSGRVYYDLLAERQQRGIDDISIVRLERLYPFPTDELKKQAGLYKAARQVFWVQEESVNQGAWFQINSYIRRCLLPEQKIYYVARSRSAAPSVGSLKRHTEEQRALVDAALSAGDVQKNVSV